MPSYAVLDIGSSQILALAGQAGVNGQLQIIGAHRQPGAGFEYGSLSVPGAARAAIEAVLHEIEQQSGQAFKEVFVSVASPNYQSVTTHFDCPVSRTVRQADVDGLLRLALSSRLPEHHMLLHVIPALYNLDGQIYREPPIGAHGRTLRLITHMVCLEEAAAKNLRQMLTACGRKLRRMFLQSFAAAQAVITPEEVELGTCVLHIGASTTELVLFTQKLLNNSLCWTMGGLTLTEDIAYLLRTPLAAADQIKQAHGCALHLMATDPQPIVVPDVGGRTARSIKQSQLGIIIEARMEEIFRQVRTEMERGKMLQDLAGGCILTGGGSQLKGVTALAEEVLGVPVRLGLPRQISEPSLCRPDYAVAAGLLQLANQATTPPILQVHP